MADCPGTGKSSWPELVGTNGQAAAALIEQQNPNVNATIVLIGSVQTPDIRCDRVRVFVNRSGVVVQTPVIG
ncbi:hypothetical protein CASFOL_022100 [Castilleja foliolosa]|uniref:Uncharacterized protein n=1 Tax=Castilleja foliolosa TaxID=1961234 RepID=A0ABD3CYI2_9LAMI